MEDLRLLIRMKRIPIWKIAVAVGVSEMTVYRWLRTYDAEHYRKIIEAIEKIEGVENDEEN